MPMQQSMQKEPQHISSNLINRQVYNTQVQQQLQQQQQLASMSRAESFGVTSIKRARADYEDYDI